MRKRPSQLVGSFGENKDAHEIWVSLFYLIKYEEVNGKKKKEEKGSLIWEVIVQQKEVHREGEKPRIVCIN